jgi:hypothetical protein
MNFLQILEFYMNFWNFKTKQNMEKQITGAGPNRPKAYGIKVVAAWLTR